MLLGIERQVQVATMASSTSDLVTLAVLAAAGVTE
jgi:malate dehydrogenase (oxaloacetate-decarboxylating)(NADP+)